LQDLVGELLGYPSTTAFDNPGFAHFRLPTPLDNLSQSPVLSLQSSSSSYVETNERFVFENHLSGLQNPVGADPVCTSTSFAGYDACTSPLDSSWSRSTPTTPSEDTLVGYFATTTGTCYGAGNVSPLPVDGTNWVGPFVHFDGIHPGPATSGPPSCAELLHSRIANHLQCQAVIDEAFPLKCELRPEGHGWDDKPIEPIEVEVTADKGAGGRKMNDMALATAPRGKRLKSRKSSARKDLLEEASSPGPALRTAARKHKGANSISKPGESVQAHRARASHNQVEKEYRNRLHGYFERLLKVLPDEGEQGDEGASGQSQSGSASSENGQHKRLSKAEVLQKARLHIKLLEDDAARRRREISGLQAALGQAADGDQ